MSKVNHTVLVVEDEEDLRNMLQDALEMYGYTVVTAPEGQAALQAMARIDHVCLVLLDLVMPGMNGWDFLKELRARPELATIPVVVHSSTTKAAPVEATRVLQKPVEIRHLLSVVQEYCAA